MSHVIVGVYYNKTWNNVGLSIISRLYGTNQFYSSNMFWSLSPSGNMLKKKFLFNSIDSTFEPRKNRIVVDGKEYPLKLVIGNILLTDVNIFPKGSFSCSVSRFDLSDFEEYIDSSKITYRSMTEFHFEVSEDIYWELLLLYGDSDAVKVTKH